MTLVKKIKKFGLPNGVILFIIVVVALILLTSALRLSNTADSVTAEVWLKIVTDKKVYARGENVTISMIIVNDSPKNYSLLLTYFVVDIYREENGEGIYSCGVHSDYIEGTPPTVIPPKSEEVIDEDVWDQTSTNPEYPPYTPVPSGKYILSVVIIDQLMDYESMKGETIIEILYD